MSVCLLVKQEYETLKKLKAEFVLACAEVENIDACSRSQLDRFLKLKRALEQARDELEEKIENNEVRTWKKLLISVRNAIAKEWGQNGGQSTGDIIEQESSRMCLVQAILSGVQWGQKDGHGNDALRATAILQNTHALGLLNEKDNSQIEVLIKHDRFQKNLSDEILSNAQRDPKDTWLAVVGLYSALKLQVFKEVDVANVQELMQHKSFRESIVKEVGSFIEGAKRDTSHIFPAVVGLRASIGLSLFSKVDRREVQTYIEQEWFQRNLIHYCVSEIPGERFDGLINVVSVVGALTELIDLSRRRRGK